MGGVRALGEAVFFQFVLRTESQPEQGVYVESNCVVSVAGSGCSLVLFLRKGH